MAYSNILVGAGTRPTQPVIRRIGIADLQEALAKGVDDFYAMPTHAMFLCVIYPIVGLLLARMAFGYSILPLLYPLASGFALVGPVAALGLYELSRRREAGLPTSAVRAFDVLGSSSIGAIMALALLLLTIFVIWVALANAIYVATFGYATPTSIEAFAHDVLTTRAGWTLILVGNLVGLLFAVLVLTHQRRILPAPARPRCRRGRGVAHIAPRGRAQSVHDDAVGPYRRCPACGRIAPAVLGLTVIVPILGHATWHLYRRVVEPQAAPPPTHPEGHRERRYAADFPAVLFPWAR